MALKVYNVLTRTKEDFVPLTPGIVKMYACGITVSGDAHIGHAYQSVVFDVITRYLRYLGYDVKYVRNYTDVDDKIIANAAKAGENPIAFAEKYMKQTDIEMDTLGNEHPTIMARATQCIDDIINFVQKLIDSGHAYVSPFGDVYFRLDSFAQYGKLSHIQVDKNDTGVRKDTEPGKQNDLDFALWKSAKPGEIAWKSPWGMGRPGWHIECSAMNLKYLGEQIDIHGGGRDLVFPHHENEIAQTESLTGKQFAKYWIHCGLVKINGQKMSKSLNNGILLKDVLAKYDADTIRFTLLRNTYSADIDITDTLLPESRKHIYKMYSTLASVSGRDFSGADDAKTDAKLAEIVNEFEKAMNDNFNTLEVIATSFAWFNFINAESAKKSTDYNLQRIVDKIKGLFAVLNILQHNPAEYVNNVKASMLQQANMTTNDIEKYIAERAAAKQNKDWATADKVRAELLERGIVLKDTPNGTDWDVNL
ncbi:MAG: cysteine--tRNA ligase [Alphaproteobacteria bacterium]|nr:cysteine--tRNA ligase [Alphaproteobacteria bacterium]